jgi:hypothetical protein
MLDVSTALSALLFVASNVVDTVLYSKFRKRDHFNYRTFTQLDPEYIQSEWEFRSAHRDLELVASLLNAMAWFSLISPILQVAWMQSHRGSRQPAVHATMAALVIGGSVSELLATVMFIGGTNAAEWLSKDFNLDDWTADGGDQIGWRVLEVGYMLMRGMMLWVDTIEWMFLYCIATLLFVSVFTQSSTKRLLSVRWASFGLVVAAFCIVDFAAEILRLADWRTFSKIAFGTSLMLRLVLLPVWLVWLARLIPKAMKSIEFDTSNAATASASPDTSLS